MAESVPFSVVVCGEALIDLIEQADGSFLARPGGSPANTAVALARQNVPTRLIARIAYDRFGALLRKHLAGSGVDLSHVIDTAQPSTLAVASLDESRSATYSFYIDGCADGAWTDADLPDPIDADAIVFSGSLALSNPGMSQAIEVLLERERAHDKVIVFDPNIRAGLVTDKAEAASRMDGWIERTTIVKASSEDVAWRHPGRPLESVARQWVEQGTALVVVTDGSEGAFGYMAESSAHCSAPAVDVVDTVGAGDTFTAGLLTWLSSNDCRTPDAIRNLSLEHLNKMLEFSAELASNTCSREGAEPPWAKRATGA